MVKITKTFRIKDTIQQSVGGILLSGPFVVTEEVWRIAENLVITQFLAIILFNVVIGYFALYEADKTRDRNVEQVIGGIPVRLISLMLVGYLAVVFLVLLISPQKTFEISSSDTINAVIICSIFSIIGAATADSVF